MRSYADYTPERFFIAGVPGNLPPPQLWPPRAKFPRKFGPLGAIFPRKYDPPSEIWPPRKHSLLYRCKLGNREASSKTKILKVFVSIYSWFA
jgi:hypothetical protein